MDIQTFPVNSSCHPTQEGDEVKPHLSFTSVYEHLAGGQQVKRQNWIRRSATVVSILLAAGGLALSIWTGLPGKGYGVHATMAGFGFELAGLVGLMIMARPHRAFGKETAARDDMAGYDALHAACNRTIEWLSHFEPRDIAGMRATLEEQRKAQDMASG